MSWRYRFLFEYGAEGISGERVRPATKKEPYGSYEITFAPRGVVLDVTAHNLGSATVVKDRIVSKLRMDMFGDFARGGAAAPYSNTGVDRRVKP